MWTCALGFSSYGVIRHGSTGLALSAAIYAELYPFGAISGGWGEPAVTRLRAFFAQVSPGFTGCNLKLLSIIHIKKCQYL